MNYTYNTLPFVCDLMRDLVTSNIQTWLFGGWAEELWGLCPPRLHHDIDLLYPASNFQLLDQWIDAHGSIECVECKRFHHKRAVKVQQVLVEFLLLEPDPRGYNTNYFGEIYQFKWPIDALVHKQTKDGYMIALASLQALQDYRSRHDAIQLAYQTYIGMEHA